MTWTTAQPARWWVRLTGLNHDWCWEETGRRRLVVELHAVMDPQHQPGLTASPSTQHVRLLSKKMTQSTCCGLPSHHSSTSERRWSDASDDVFLHHHQNTKLCFYGRHLITDKKVSFLCPPSGTEMRLYASLQGDLVVFDGLTPDFLSMHLSFRQLAKISTNG